MFYLTVLCLVRHKTIFGKSRDQNRKCLITQRVTYVLHKFSNATAWAHSNTKSVAWILQKNVSQKNHDVIRPSFDTLFKISLPYFLQIEIPCYSLRKIDGKVSIRWKNCLVLSFPVSFCMFFSETHDRGLGLVAHARSDWSDVRFPSEKLLQRTIQCKPFCRTLD